MILENCINYLKFSADEHRSFSQLGEDKFMWGFLRHLKTGYYVDIGSSHPINGNNTYLFYLNNWNGICIDPLLSEDLYKIHRPKDLTIKKFFSNNNEPFYYCDELNQISGAKVFSTFKDFTFEEKKVEYISSNEFRKKIQKHINLLSIDCEGLDIDILKSIDDFYSDVICIEIIEERINELDSLLLKRDYKRHYYNLYNAIYIRNSYLKLINPF
jgi:hypothetical protein